MLLILRPNLFRVHAYVSVERHEWLVETFAAEEVEIRSLEIQLGESSVRAGRGGVCPCSISDKYICFSGPSVPRSHYSP